MFVENITTFQGKNNFYYYMSKTLILSPYLSLSKPLRPLYNKVKWF